MLGHVYADLHSRGEMIPASTARQALREAITEIREMHPEITDEEIARIKERWLDGWINRFTFQGVHLA